METITITRGATRDESITIYKPGTTDPATDTFQSTDEIYTTVWPGDDRPSVASPSTAWVDADLGQFRISFAYADTSTLEVASYSIRTYVRRGDSNPVVFEGVLKVLAAPGSGTAPKVYGSYQDLLRELPWLDQLEETQSDQTGFAEQRADARDWLDEIILRSYPRLGPGLLSTQAYWWWPAPTGAGTAYSLLGDPTLKEWLDDDRLVLTGASGRKLVRAVTYYAIALILARAVRPGGNNGLTDLAAKYQRMAQYQVATAVAEIDSDDDGTADIAIPLNVTNTRLG